MIGEVEPIAGVLPTGGLLCGMPLTGDYEPSPTKWAADQADLYENSGGTEGTTINGMPVILMTTVGNKSGKLRRTPLGRVEHDGQYAAVASHGGSPTHPVWYYNVRSDPHVEVRDGTDKWDMIAREVTGAEKALWWERSVAAHPDYADYQKNTDREIPVFVLSKASG